MTSPPRVRIEGLTEGPEGTARVIGKLGGCVYLLSKEQPGSVRLSLGRAAMLKVQDFVHDHHAVGFQDRGSR